MSEHPKNLDELRADFIARQRTLVPFDPAQRRFFASAPLWKEGEGVGRRFTVAIFLLLFATGLIAIPIRRDFEDGTIVYWLAALGVLFLSWRVFRDAFRTRRQFRHRSSKQPERLN
jgi:hypothetical protein